MLQSLVTTIVPKMGQDVILVDCTFLTGTCWIFSCLLDSYITLIYIYIWLCTYHGMHVKATWRSWHSPPTRWVIRTKLKLWTLAAGAIIHQLLTLAPFFLYIGDLWFCCWCYLGLGMQPHPVAQASLNPTVIFPLQPLSAAIAVMSHTPAVHHTWQLAILFMCTSLKGVLVLLLIPLGSSYGLYVNPLSDDWLQRFPLILQAVFTVLFPLLRRRLSARYTRLPSYWCSQGTGVFPDRLCLFYSLAFH